MPATGHELTQESEMQQNVSDETANLFKETGDAGTQIYLPERYTNIVGHDYEPTKKNLMKPRIALYAMLTGTVLSGFGWINYRSVHQFNRRLAVFDSYALHVGRPKASQESKRLLHHALVTCGRLHSSFLCLWHNSDFVGLANSVSLFAR